MYARLVYFPFLIVTLLIGFVSWIGNRIKRHHLIIANFAIMLSPLEHICLFTQMLLSFAYGTYALAIPIIFIWLGYIASLIVFGYYWHKQILANDYKLGQY